MNQNESPRPKAPVSEDAELVRLIGIIKDWRFADRHGGTEDANNRILAKRIILSRSPIDLDSLGTERASEVVRLDGPDEEVVRWRDISRALLRDERAEDASFRHPAFRVLKDGDQFCAILADFKNLRESQSGWGSTPQEALANLIEPAPKPEGRTCDGAEAIHRERERQKAVEGWTPEHDDEHHFGELAKAAAAYALGRADLFPKSWNLCWWKTPRKPNGEIDRKRELEKAGALIAAEWDRLDRMDPAASDGKSEALSCSTCVTKHCGSCGAHSNHEPAPKPEGRTCETCKRYWRDAKKCKWLGHVPRNCRNDGYSDWEPAASDGKEEAQG